LKVKVAQQHPKNLIDLKRCIKREWRSLPVELAKNLVESMQRRIRQVVANKGDFTTY